MRAARATGLKQATREFYGRFRRSAVRSRKKSSAVAKAVEELRHRVSPGNLFHDAAKQPSEQVRSGDDLPLGMGPYQDEVFVRRVVFGPFRPDNEAAPDPADDGYHE
jgi:hypothetical protein